MQKSNGTSASVERLFREKFAEIVEPLAPEEAVLEANRCLYCYDAPCVQSCPTHIDIPRFIKQIASKNLTGSAKTILEANALGHSCARVCPVEVLCEGACVYHHWQEKPIEIARLQRHATDAFLRQGRRAFAPGSSNALPVAIIGAGPAGLSCATYLLRLGHPVVLFERQKLPGGLNTHGVAEYKMSSKVSLDEVRQVLSAGAQLRAGVEIGKDINVADLEKSFKAVFFAIGLGATHSLNIRGEGLPGVWDALNFIAHLKSRRLSPLGRSRSTVVIGGGNTAIDAVTQSKRLGAEKVIFAYRRGPGEMSAYEHEYELAKSDGVEFLWHAVPTAILGKKRVEGVRFQKTRVAKGGRVEMIAGTQFDVPCDRVIKAIGQSKQRELAAAAGIAIDAEGRVRVDPETLRTSNPKWFAGGDAVNGGKEVVNAVADGKRAAWGIHRSLTGAQAPSPENAYWVSTIDGRRVAPIPAR